MEFMQKILFEELSQVIMDIPFNRMLGLSLDEIEKNNVTLSFSMKEELVGNFFFGILHGGVISSVIDMAGGVAAMSFALQQHPEKSVDELKEILVKASTINLQVSYVQPGKGEHFVAKAVVMHGGKRLCFTRITLANETGKLIATGEATYSIV
jgi:uncharacterized protein (TIGR00369 family)